MNAPVTQPSESHLAGGKGAGQARGSRRAVVDIGTNAVKMLLGEVSGSHVEPLLETNEQTRLGRGLYESQQLRSEAMTATIEAVSRFVDRARAEGAVSIRVIATSAVREARNAALLLDKLTAKCGLPVEVISGETEADLVFRGVSLNPQLGRGPKLVIDVGGGSTEFILGAADRCVFRQSYPLGAVRMLEKARLNDPPGSPAHHQYLESTMEFLREHVVPALAVGLGEHPPRLLVGTGGSATILARIARKIAQFDREAIEQTQLKLGEVADEVARLWRLSLASRRVLVGMPPERADIVIMGAVIYEAVMRTFAINDLRVSTRGLRFAALLDPV